MSGVNSLVMKSKKPNAKQFQNWITAEVIPQIRKHGFYHQKEHKPSALAHEDGYARIKIGSERRDARQIPCETWSVHGQSRYQRQGLSF